jgi:hypothetical protein
MRSMLQKAVARSGSTVAVLTLMACEGTTAPKIDVVLSQPAVHLRAVRGSASEVSQTITVSNGGSGRLGPVTCPASPAAWLSCSVASGNVVTFTASPVGLVQSPASVSVPITAPGTSNPASVTVDLTIDQPVLTVSTASISFSGVEGFSTTSPVNATVNVANTGAGTLANLGMVTCAPVPAAQRVACNVNQSTGSLTITVDPSGLAPATYIYPLSVTSANNSTAQVVTVTLVISALPKIALSQTTMHFSALRGTTSLLTQTVTVSNGGGGTLGTISCPANPATWLACLVSGSTATFAANPSGLSVSPATVSVPVTAVGASNSPRTVTVSLSIEQPIVALASNSVTFAGQEGVTPTTPTSATVGVTNTGAGTLSDLGAISCVVALPVTCAVTPSTGVLTLAVDPTGLAGGTYIVVATVSAANSGVSRALSVILTVTGVPRMALSPSSFNFRAVRGSTVPTSDQLIVINRGGGSLGTVTCPAAPASWLSCTKVDSVTFTFTANPSGLTLSPGAVLVPMTSTTAANSPQDVTVHLEIEQPVLSLSGTTATFTAVAPATTSTPATIQITASNVGAGTLSDLGAISCASGSPKVTCGVNATTGVLTLSANPTGLGPGTTTYTVTVSAPNQGNGPQTITVILTVS